jgi:hypothetical protein
MKDSHLTLRLPVALVRALVRRAREAGVARSHLVREAVTAYLAGPPASVIERHEVTAADLAGRWRTLPRLEPEEATSFARDLTDARAALPVPPGWE